MILFLVWEGRGHFWGQSSGKWSGNVRVCRGLLLHLTRGCRAWSLRAVLPQWRRPLQAVIPGGKGRNIFSVAKHFVPAVLRLCPHPRQARAHRLAPCGPPLPSGASVSRLCPLPPALWPGFSRLAALSVPERRSRAFSPRPTLQDGAKDPPASPARPSLTVCLLCSAMSLLRLRRLMVLRRLSPRTPECAVSPSQTGFSPLSANLSQKLTTYDSFSCVGQRRESCGAWLRWVSLSRVSSPVMSSCVSVGCGVAWLGSLPRGVGLVVPGGRGPGSGSLQRPGAPCGAPACRPPLLGVQAVVGPVLPPTAYGWQGTWAPIPQPRLVRATHPPRGLVSPRMDGRKLGRDIHSLAGQSAPRVPTPSSLPLVPGVSPYQMQVFTSPSHATWAFPRISQPMILFLVWARRKVPRVPLVQWARSSYGALPGHPLRS